MVNNSTLKDIRESFKADGFSDLLADGDMTALNDLVHSELTEVYRPVRRNFKRGVTYVHLIHTCRHLYNAFS